MYSTLTSSSSKSEIFKTGPVSLQDLSLKPKIAAFCWAKPSANFLKHSVISCFISCGYFPQQLDNTCTSRYEANNPWTFLLLQIWAHDQSSRAFQVQWKLIHCRDLEMISIKLCNLLRVYQKFMKWFINVNAKHRYCRADWLQNLHLYKAAVQDCNSIDVVLVLF